MYRCAKCKTIVGPYVKKAINTRVIATRIKKYWNDGSPRTGSEIVKEESYCPPCASIFDENHIPPAKPHSSNVIRISATPSNINNWVRDRFIK